MNQHIRVQASDKQGSLVEPSNPTCIQAKEMNRESLSVTAAAFLVLFCIVGMALWGLPFYYDFMVQQFGWTRAQVTPGNALSKLVVGPIFAVVYVFAAIFGIGLGGDYLIVPLVTAEIFGVQVLGRLLGVILTAGRVAEAVAPRFVGRMRDSAGSSRGAFLR